jgi:hypothetical protein
MQRPVALTAVYDAMEEACALEKLRIFNAIPPVWFAVLVPLLFPLSRVSSWRG